MIGKNDDPDLKPFFTEFHDDYDWIDFFKEASDSLLKYKTDRKPLYRMIKKLGYYDRDDVTPFSVLGWIYRRRLKPHPEAVDMANFLGIKAKIPLGKFAAHIDPRFSYFIQRKDKRGAKDVEILWKVFEDALNYADKGRKSDVKKFKESFTAANELYQVPGNITIVLFWCRPDKFLALDTNTKNCLAKWGIHVPGKVDGESYLAIMEKLRNKLPMKGISSFTDFVWDALVCEDRSAEVKKIQRVLGSNVSPKRGTNRINAVVKDFSPEDHDKLADLGYYVYELPASDNREFTVFFLGYEGRIIDGIKADMEKIQRVLGPNLNIVEDGILSAVMPNLLPKELDKLADLGYYVDGLPKSGNKKFTVEIVPIEKVEKGIKKADMEKIQRAFGSSVKLADDGSRLNATVRSISHDDIRALLVVGYDVDSILSSDGGEFTVEFRPGGDLLEKWLKTDKEKIQRMLGSGAKCSAYPGMPTVVKRLTGESLIALWNLGYWAFCIHPSDGKEFAVKLFQYSKD